MQAQSKQVEYSLEANEFKWNISSGKTVKAFGFNNQLPGPVLRAGKGDTMVVKVKNNQVQQIII